MSQDTQNTHEIDNTGNTDISQDSKPEQVEQMGQMGQAEQLGQSSQPAKAKRKSLYARIPPRVRTALAILVIAVAVVLAFHGPTEGDVDNVTGDPDPAFVPTVAITNQVDSVVVNKSADVKGVHFVVTDVTEATHFSDDRKLNGVYTLRVNMHSQVKGSQPVGIPLDTYVTLHLANGQSIVPKYISLVPLALPNQINQGFIDFPLAAQVPISSLSLHMGNDATITFTA